MSANIFANGTHLEFSFFPIQNIDKSTPELKFYVVSEHNTFNFQIKRAKENFTLSEHVEAKKHISRFNSFMSNEAQ